jgi:hypothetical protein
MMAACWPLQVPPTAKAVLLVLAEHADEWCRCWPSLARIGNMTCHSERAVRNALRWLEQKGVIRVEIGAGKANRYTVTPQVLLAAQCVEPVVNAAPPPPLRLVSTPAPDAGVPRHDVPPTPAPGAGHPGTTCPLTSIEPIPNTPPNPPTGGNEPESGLSIQAASSKRASRPQQPLRTIETWLRECKASGVRPLAEDDPVIRYAETCHIGGDLLALQWWVFKRRRAGSGKMQRDWPRTFRNSVEQNWFRLWFIAPGRQAELTTQGHQALAAMQAEAAERDTLLREGAAA